MTVQSPIALLAHTKQKQLGRGLQRAISPHLTVLPDFDDTLGRPEERPHNPGQARAPFEIPGTLGIAPLLISVRREALGVSTGNAIIACQVSRDT